jgi:hypothetical protein
MLQTVGRFILLTLITFVLHALDVWGLSLSPLLQSAPWLLLLAALIDATVLSIAIPRASGAGWSLAARLALLIFGVKTAVVVVEAFYLPDVISPAWIPGLLFNGFVTATLLALAAVWLNRRWASDFAVGPYPPRARFSWWRWPLSGVLWVVLFVAAGALIFQPVARAIDPAAAEAYLTGFMPENPLLILLFQAGRGLLWGLFAWPFLSILRGRHWQRGLVLGLLFAGLMSSAQLLGIDFLPPRIWPAHLLEVVVENFLFGLVVAWGLRPRDGFTA